MNTTKRCLALTKDNKQCQKNVKNPTSNYCGNHQNSDQSGDKVIKAGDKEYILPKKDKKSTRMCECVTKFNHECKQYGYYTCPATCKCGGKCMCLSHWDKAHDNCLTAVKLQQKQEKLNEAIKCSHILKDATKGFCKNLSIGLDQSGNQACGVHGALTNLVIIAKQKVNNNNNGIKNIGKTISTTSVAANTTSASIRLAVNEVLPNVNKHKNSHPEKYEIFTSVNSIPYAMLWGKRLELAANPELYEKDSDSIKWLDHYIYLHIDNKPLFEAIGLHFALLLENSTIIDDLIRIFGMKNMTWLINTFKYVATLSHHRKYEQIVTAWNIFARANKLEILSESKIVTLGEHDKLDKFTPANALIQKYKAAKEANLHNDNNNNNINNIGITV